MATGAEFRALQAKAMSEDELGEHVRDLCKAYDVTRVHHLRSKGTTPGWPDDALIGTRLLLRELKRQDNYPTPAQRDMIAALQAAGEDVDVWKPTDLLSGRIRREIAAISPRHKRGGAATMQG